MGGQILQNYRSNIPNGQMSDILNSTLTGSSLSFPSRDRHARKTCLVEDKFSWLDLVIVQACHWPRIARKDIKEMR